MNTDENTRVEAILRGRYGVPISIEEHAAFQRAVTGTFTGNVSTSQSKDGTYLNETAGRAFHLWLLAVDWALQQCAKGLDPRSAQSPAAAPAQGEPVAIHQWRERARGSYQPAWYDAPRDEAYERVDEHYEARTLYTGPAAQADEVRDAALDQDMMLWLSDDNEVFANGPDDFANDYASNCLHVGDVAEVGVDCAHRLLSRTMRIALVPKEGDQDDYEVVWNWVERTTTADNQKGGHQ